MENLNLKKLWEVCNTLSNKQSELCEQNIFVYLLGRHSDYGEIFFENFLGYYSFKIEDDGITVFNNEKVPHEDFTNNDFSYIPLSLLSFAEKDLEKWMDGEIENQLTQQKRYKLAQKESIEQKIKQLETQLNNL